MLVSTFCLSIIGTSTASVCFVWEAQAPCRGLLASSIVLELHHTVPRSSPHPPCERSRGAPLARTTSAQATCRGRARVTCRWARDEIHPLLSSWLRSRTLCQSLSTVNLCSFHSPALTLWCRDFVLGHRTPNRIPRIRSQNFRTVVLKTSSMSHVIYVETSTRNRPFNSATRCLEFRKTASKSPSYTLWGGSFNRKLFVLYSSVSL